MTENIDTEEKELPINALRVCEAIAKIGYTPSAALMDLADNSFTASATQIHISLSTVGNYAKKGNVIEYGIMDNGSGMDEVGIENALRLGSDDDYQQDSLSKFGMGLKSAGFSLGAKIVVFSRKDGNATAWELDRDEIERRQAYIIKRALNIDELSEQFNTAFDNETSGTFIQVTKTECNNNESAKKSIEKLTSQLGIVYYEFLKENDRSIEVAATGKPNITISPIDILHKEDATISYNSDQYEGKKPCISYDHELAIGDSEDCPKLRLEISLFPQDGMKSYAAFSEGERKKIASYKVNRKHKGFFIYRNGRLIRWGDNLDGIVSRDRIGFRARLSLNTSHDNYLHVDVSKQHLNISEDILAKVQRACEQSLRWHVRDIQ